MSKQRPSSAAVGRETADPRGTGGVSTSWHKRIFHNSYTRGGRRIVLRGWSVKLQHQGKRRTFSLRAGSRAAAAREARAISERLSTAGWGAVVEPQRNQRDDGLFRSAATWWKERLLLRNYPLPADGNRQTEFSTYIEHGGARSYFPLETSDRELAAARSLRIYRRVVQEGWSAATRLFSREITVAFHWDHEPLLWTYTTIHTICEAEPHAESDAAVDANPNSILLVEPDPTTRAAIAQCLRQHPGVNCIACATVKAARLQRPAARIRLALVNRDVAGSMGLVNSAQIDAAGDGYLAISYGLHVDSEDLFARTPGGASAYLLKRTASGRILDPVREGLEGRRITPETLQQSWQTYFQQLMRKGVQPEISRGLTQLTQREKDVLNLMSRGLVDKRIAPALGISIWTVHEHVKRIFEKLRVHSRTEAVLAYLQK